MKLIILVEHLDIRRGGLERWTSRFIQWLTCEGHQVTVVAITATADCLPSGVTYHALPAKTSRMERAVAAAEMINRMKADIVYDLGVGIGADILHPQFGSRFSCAAAELKSQPAWFRLWKRLSPAALLRQKQLRDFEDKQYRGQRGMLIVPSHIAAAPLIERYRLNEQQIRIVYNGVDPEHYRPEHLAPLREPTRKHRGLDAQHIHLLLVAMNLRLKGADTALRALAKLPDTFFLTIVGGTRYASFQRMARRLGIAGRVHFIEPCDDPRRWYASADILVHPTRHDAGSLCVLEAWASGLPAITTRKNGSAELMTEGLHGFIMADPEDATSLAGFISRLSDDKLRKEMEAPCRALAQQHSFSDQFRSIARIAREIIDSGQATGRMLNPNE